MTKELRQHLGTLEWLRRFDVLTVGERIYAPEAIPTETDGSIVVTRKYEVRAGAVISSDEQTMRFQLSPEPDFWERVS